MLAKQRTTIIGKSPTPREGWDELKIWIIMEDLDLRELSLNELREGNGGGWIADAVENFLCALKCNPYPSGMYHNTMMMRGI